MTKLKDESEGKLNNKGFSLVELIIAVAILAIAVIPLMRAFSLAARTNGKAAAMQNATSIAEDVMEEIKGMSIEQLELKYSATTGAGNSPAFFAKDGMTSAEITARDSYLAGKIGSGADGVVIKEEDGFYVFYKPNAENNNDTYHVVATIDSTFNTDDNEYSNTSSTSGKVDNANVIELPVLEKINVGNNVAISTEFNKYDESAIARLIDLYYDEKPTEIEIDDATNKIVTTSLSISNKSKDTLIDVYKSSDTVKITATTTYSVTINGINKSFSKVIYSNFFRDSIDPQLYLFYKTMNEYLDMEYQAGSGDTSGKAKLSDKMATDSIYRIDSETLTFNCNDSSYKPKTFILLDKYYGLNGSAYEYDLNAKDTDNLFSSGIKNTSKKGTLSVGGDGAVDLTTYIDGVASNVYESERGDYLYKINVILTKDDGKVYAYLTSNKAAD